MCADSYPSIRDRRVFSNKLSQSPADSPRFDSSKRTRLSRGFSNTHVPAQFIASIFKFHTVVVHQFPIISCRSFRTTPIFIIFLFHHFQICVAVFSKCLAPAFFCFRVSFLCFETCIPNFFRHSIGQQCHAP